MLNFLKGRKTEKGFTLVEFLVVLGLIFVLVAVIAMAAYKSTQRTRVSRVKSEVMSISAAAETWGANKALRFSGVNMDQLKGSDQLSEDLVTNNYTNPWGGAYTIDNSGPHNVNGSTYTVTIAGIPTDQIAQDVADTLRPMSLDQANSVADGTQVQVEFR